MWVSKFSLFTAYIKYVVNNIYGTVKSHKTVKKFIIGFVSMEEECKWICKVHIIIIITNKALAMIH